MHDSAWRVDPDRAAGGYAIALVVAAALTVAWLAWGLLADDGDAGAGATSSVERAARAAPWVVGFVLLAIMGLGTTKRCFGFGRGTVHALVMAVLFQVATFTSGLGELGRDALAMVVGVPLAGGLAVTLFLGWRHRRQLESARQAVAGFAYFAGAFTWVRAATLRFELHRGLGGEGAALVSAGIFLGATIAAIGWLTRSWFRAGTRSVRN